MHTSWLFTCTVASVPSHYRVYTKVPVCDRQWTLLSIHRPRPLLFNLPGLWAQIKARQSPDNMSVIFCLKHNTLVCFIVLAGSGCRQMPNVLSQKFWSYSPDKEVCPCGNKKVTGDDGATENIQKKDGGSVWERNSREVGKVGEERGKRGLSRSPPRN